MLLCCRPIPAQEEVFSLGEVVVTGSRPAQTPITTQAVVTDRDIRATGAQTVDQAVYFLPGVTIQNPGKNTRQVNIRGFSGSQVKVLVDGIPANETFFRVIDLSQFPAAGISQIKVIKGLPSVLYGANGMGGVVNIITRKGGATPSASGHFLAADESTLHATVNGGGQFERINCFVTYAYQTSDGYPCSADFNRDDPETGIDSPYHEDGGLRDNSDYIKRSLTAKLGYESENSSVFLHFDQHDNSMGIPVEYNRYWRYPVWKQWHLGLTSEKDMEDFTLYARVFYLKHDDTLRDNTVKTTALGGRSWFDESVYDDYSAGGTLRCDWSFSEIGILRAQADYQFEQNRQQELNPRTGSGSLRVQGWTEEAVYETAIWDFALENEWQLDQLLCVAGVSYDLYRPLHSSDVDPGDDIDVFNPQAGIHYAFTEHLDLYGSFGRKTRFPHMKELYSSHAGGNPDLDPEYTDSLDLGTHITLPTTFATRLHAAVFNNEIRDMILSVETPEGDARYENIGRAVTRGVEIGCTVEPVNDMALSLNYTWLHAQDEELDRRLPKLPRHRITSGLRWTVLPGSSLFTQLSYAEGAQEYLFSRSTRTEHTRDLPDYLLWNMGLEQALGSHVTLIARADNLLDEHYDIGDGPMPGRRLWAGCRFKW
jgi:iron complex outermembrane receptor protein/outer membrane receptor for ferrienterochelin and colicins